MSKNQISNFAVNIDMDESDNIDYLRASQIMNKSELAEDKRKSVLHQVLENNAENKQIENILNEIESRT